MTEQQIREIREQFANDLKARINIMIILKKKIRIGDLMQIIDDTLNQSIPTEEEIKQNMEESK